MSSRFARFVGGVWQQMSRDARVTVTEAAARMGVNPQFLRMGLRLGRFPFGTAVQMPGGRWSYYINAERFRRYMAGEDMAEAGVLQERRWLHQ